MIDAKLRELERAWRGTGAVADESAYLHERVRAGALSYARLELAAYCGHAAAIAAFEDAANLQRRRDRHQDAPACSQDTKRIGHGGLRNTMRSDEWAACRKLG